MGLRNKITAAAFGLGGLAIAAAPSAGAATPSNLIGHAEFDAVQEGMTLAQVESIVAQHLTFTYESKTQYSKGQGVSQTWEFEGEFGDCRQRAYFYFDNMDDNFNPGPFVLDSKSVYEYDCGGIIK